uniref:Pentatricopeptide repeat-containing protein At3g61360 n=2 Tax=Rhizophora mucronata TaxID=61149 RepID=A0A2P2ILK4_RHIMU
MGTLQTWRRAYAVLKDSPKKHSQRFEIPFKRLHSSSQPEVQRIIRIINDHSFPDKPLYPNLLQHLRPTDISTNFAENVLGCLFAAHTNGIKALEFFRFCLSFSHFIPSSDAFEKTLHILARMCYFEKAWELMEEFGKAHPSLLTCKSMSIMLCKIAKFQTYEDMLEAFERMEKAAFVGKEFGTEEFNVLLRAFCTQRKMKEARSVFQKMYDRFPPNTKTMNILLLGFKESGDVTAMELFYHEMLRRGFKPTSLTFGIRIDAYCKRGCFGDALRIFEEMELANCLPTLEIITTLIHGAGIARNTLKARQLFDEIPKRNLQPDIGAYNALINTFIRCREVTSAMRLMDEMEEKQIGHDNVTYHAMYLGLMKSSGIKGVDELYNRMTKINFVPKTRTVVMLMKFFCVNSQLDLGLNLWEYLLEKGYCPHGHALDILVTGLCSRGRLEEAFECCKQFLERGMRISATVYQMLARILVQSDKPEKLKELNHMIKKLQSVLPPSRGHAIGKSSSVAIEKSFLT